MKVTGSSIQQLDKYRANGTPKPRSECRKWRLWATTEQGRKSRRFNGTWTAAQRALDAFVAELEGFVPNGDTFAAHAASWRLWRASMGGLSPGTVENDRRNVAALCRTDLAGMRMDAIAPADVRDALMWLKENPLKPTATGQLSGTTMNKVVQTCKAIFAQALADGIVESDPAAKLPTPPCDTRERDALTPAELSAFLDAVDDMPMDGRTMALYLMACLGLRRGEACALLDDDLSGGFCHVHQSVKERDNSVDGPKTPAGVRTLPVPDRLQARVDGWRALRAERGIECPYLCCNTHGQMLTIQPFQKWWARNRGKLGCDGMTMHQLRHSNLSMVSRHMSTFDLQAYAGWASLQPARVYVHRDLDSVQRAVDDAWKSLA